MPPPVSADRRDVTHLPRGMTLPESGALPLSGLTVLLVEDSRFSSDALRLLCQRSGARMRRAETLERARAHLRTYRSDVVIVDLGLPDGRGEDLIRSIAKSGRVVIAASGDPDGRAGALQAGAAGFMDKPLPGLAAFQKAILRHLPERFAVMATATDRPEGDEMALRDDLQRAVGLMDAPGAVAGSAYLAGFLEGLARSTGDAGLARAAALAEALPDGGAEALAEARDLVSARLASKRVI